MPRRRFKVKLDEAYRLSFKVDKILKKTKKRKKNAKSISHK